MKTTKLNGDLLDYWVYRVDGGKDTLTEFYAAKYQGRHAYSTEWNFGGPIIERERIHIAFVHDKQQWRADARGNTNAPALGYGPTPLVAAMRAYVAKKCGEEVPHA